MATYYSMHRDEILKKCAANRGAKTEYNKSYYILNKEKLDARYKDRAERQNGLKIECGCGSYIKSDSVKIHNTTAKHKKALEGKETICDCGMRLWIADCEFKMHKHINNPFHQNWLNDNTNADSDDDAKCDECLEEEVVIVLPDLILTDEEVGFDKEAEIKRLMDQKEKRNEYAKTYYHLNRDKMVEMQRDYYNKNKQKRCDASKAYSNTERGKQLRWDREHRIVSCACGWSGIYSSNSKHKSQTTHLIWLKNKQ